jgi:hypothetical protein
VVLVADLVAALQAVVDLAVDLAVADSLAVEQVAVGNVSCGIHSS